MSVTTSTFLLRCSVPEAGIDSTIVEIPFYPPDTISGKNVFMTMVCAATNHFELQNTNPAPADGVSFLISCLDLPQSVGTISDNKTYDCQRSNVLGIVQSSYDKTSFTKGPLILTYIPNGLQTLRFRIDTLTNGIVNNSIKNSAMFTIIVQFEVSGTR
jgi:hypothetical protein